MDTLSKLARMAHLGTVMTNGADGLWGVSWTVGGCEYSSRDADLGKAVDDVITKSHRGEAFKPEGPKFGPKK